MTNQMIPFSFVPGTKAKAGEVNANFIAIANEIEKNNSDISQDITDINGKIKEINTKKADKIDLELEHEVQEPATDLNDYKTKGTYIFSELTAPTNSPKEGAEGILVVTGTETTVKQIWFLSEENTEIFTRCYKQGTWNNWSSHTGIANVDNPGYLELPNGLLVQWGKAGAGGITYPLAFETLACPVFEKNGCNGVASRSDTGFMSQTLTGFVMGTSGAFSDQNWIAIGY